jgi:hypothetical protein
VKMMTKASSEAREPYVFKANDLCIFIGCARNEAGHDHMKLS